MTGKEIKVFAYSRSGGRLNFGDDMSPDFISHVTGRSVRSVECHEAEVLGIGSILHHAVRRKAVLKLLKTSARRGRRPIVWGSGMISGERPLFRSHLRYLSVRGPLTAQSLRLKDARFGDPGIIARDVVDAGRKTHRLGIVPHYVEARSEAVRKFSEAVPHSQIISVEQDWRSVIRRISECELIVSSSLHGLIVADSFEIPNVRATFSSGNLLENFKFRDYAASVGRPDECAPFQDLFDAVRTVQEEAFEYRKGVDKLRADVLTTGAAIVDLL